MTQDLIKKMREEYAKQQEEKLIQEQIEQINLEANAAPTPSATNTPQQMLDRTVATIKKVNEIKANGSLQVINMSLTDDVKVNISTMDGTTAEKTLVARDYVDGAVALLNTSKADANLKVMGENDALVDLSTMDGTTSAKALITRNRADAVAQYWATTKLSGVKVWANDGTAHSISEMDGTTADKTLITRQFNATKLATKQDTLTRTLTLVLDDNTTTDIKVG